MKQWVTVADAADILQTTERTIYRQIKEGKIEARLENNRRLVCVTRSDNVMTADSSPLLAEKDARMTALETHLDYFKQQLTEKDHLIRQLQENQVRLQQTLDEALQSRSQADERADTIIMTLTQQVKEQQLMIEDLRNRPQGLWQRFKQRFQGTPQTQEAS